MVRAPALAGRTSCVSAETSPLHDSPPTLLLLLLLLVPRRRTDFFFRAFFSLL